MKQIRLVFRFHDIRCNKVAAAYLRSLMEPQKLSDYREILRNQIVSRC